MVTNKTKGTVLADHLEITETFLSRLIGLLGRRNMEDGQSLLIKRCSHIHTFFMCFNIDVVFLDRDNRVTKTVKGLRPFRIALAPTRTVSVLELPTGRIDKSQSQAGDLLLLLYRNFNPI